MSEKNEKLGLLLLFDCIAVILSTFGTLFIFQMVSHESDVNLMIVSCFFVGIKILLMGIGDITGIAKKIWIACILVLVANVIVFGINIFMAFGISKGLIGITFLVDIVFVIISHLIWGKIFAVALNEKKERKAWLNNKDDDDDTTEEEYDDIFASLVTKDGSTNEIDTVAINQKIKESDKMLEDEEDYESEDDEYEDFSEEDFDDYDEEDFVDYEEDDEEEQILFDDKIIEEDVNDKDTYLDEEAFKNLLINEDDLNKVEPENTKVEDEIVDESVDNIEKLPEEAIVVPAIEDILGTKDTLEPKVGTEMSMIKDELPSEDKENLTDTEKRLGSLLNEINASTRNAEHLEATVAEFRKELDTLMPITTDTDIIKTGDVIRDKLKTIIDKQFIVDEVLDDLIRLSKQINKRIDDLDTIEMNLNKRKEALDQKELLYMNKKPVDFEDVDVQILPEEVMLENEESEIIIDQGDLETIKAYLKDHPEV
ncbi:MAG: hypothetical protein RSB21_01865 [Eubacterium sp.]